MVSLFRVIALALTVLPGAMAWAQAAAPIDMARLLSGLSQMFLYLFIVPVQLLARVRLREFPLDSCLVLITPRLPS
jgi:hypothetical protein